MSSVDVKDHEGTKTASVELPGDIFDVQANIPLMHQVVVAQLAAARQGTHKVKTRPGVAQAPIEPGERCLRSTPWLDLRPWKPCRFITPA